MRRFLESVVLLVSLLVPIAHAQTGPITVRYSGQTKDRHFQEVVLYAIDRILKFSKTNKLGIENSSDFVTDAIVYDSKDGFDHMVETSPGWPKGRKASQAYLGVSKNKTFYVVDWPVFKTVHPGEKISEYENLLTHELMHLFHVAYLKGDESKMGPLWFYEGLACLVAGQYIDSPLPKRARLHQILFTKQRNSYRDYAAILVAMTKVKPIVELLKHAPDADFGKQSEALLAASKGPSHDSKQVDGAI